MDVVAVVSTVAPELETAHPEPTVRVDATEVAGATATDRRLLEVAVEPQGENAVEHNPDVSPSVEFRVESGAEPVSISVADDGSGIPAEERSVIAWERET